MKVVSYLRGIPNAKNQEKIDVLRYFIDGVNHCGDEGILSNDFLWKPSSAAVLEHRI
jgi:hypothetical protein